MYVVTEADAAAIKEAYETGGELSAAVELRRRFPGIVDNATAREQARRIAAWTPLPGPPQARSKGQGPLICQFVLKPHATIGQVQRCPVIFGVASIPYGT